MTTILSVGCNAYVVQAGDRLLSKMAGDRFAGVHDTLANKMVIYLTADAVCAIGYSGQAYVGTVPTDEWIARHLWGADFQSGWRGAEIATFSFARCPNRWRIGRARWELAKAIDQEPKIKSVLALTMAGWRRRRGRAIPFIVTFGRAPANHSRSEAQMRRWWPLERTIQVCGIGNVPPEDVTLEAFRRAAKTAGGGSIQTAALALAELVHAQSLTTPTVGDDVMLALLHHPSERKITVRFAPSKAHHLVIETARGSLQEEASFTPWVVTPSAYSPPTISTVGGGSSLHLGEWVVEFEGPKRRSRGRTGVFFAQSTQVRTPPPL